MATTESLNGHEPAADDRLPHGGVQLRHIPLSKIVVLSRGSAASVRMVARSGRSREDADGGEAPVLRSLPG